MTGKQEEKELMIDGQGAGREGEEDLLGIRLCVRINPTMPSEPRTITLITQSASR